jgi:hypothetical protein
LCSASAKNSSSCFDVAHISMISSSSFLLSLRASEARLSASSRSHCSSEQPSVGAPVLPGVRLLRPSALCQRSPLTVRVRSWGFGSRGRASWFPAIAGSIGQAGRANRPADTVGRSGNRVCWFSLYPLHSGHAVSGRSHSGAHTHR